MISLLKQPNNMYIMSNTLWEGGIDSWKLIDESINELIYL